LIATDEVVNKKRIAPLTVVLGIVFVFFCAILVWAYVETKRINPVMLDEHGNSTNQPAQQSSGEKK
jgi:predicted transporter